MTVYPDWIKVSCDTCGSKPYELCTAVFNLPKGTTLRVCHAKRYAKYEEVRNKGKILSPDTISNGGITNSDT